MVAAPKSRALGAIWATDRGFLGETSAGVVNEFKSGFAGLAARRRDFSPPASRGGTPICCRSHSSSLTASAAPSANAAAQQCHTALGRQREGIKQALLEDVPCVAERRAPEPRAAAAQPRAAAEPRRAAVALRRQPAPAQEETRPAARARRHGTVQPGQHVLHELGVASFSSCPASPGLLRGPRRSERKGRLHGEPRIIER